MIARGTLAGLALSVCLTAAGASGHQLTNGRITLDQANGAGGFNTTNQDRVDSIAWIDSAGSSTGNLASNGGGPLCGEPLEFFGQSYDEGDGAGLYNVISGTVSSWKLAPSGLAGTAKTNGKDTCSGLHMSSITTTTYTLSNNKKLVNALKIKRQFKFNAYGATQPFNIRSYVPRLPIAKYNTVLLPEIGGTVHSYTATSCAGACQLPNWNGKWFAEDDGTGRGMVVIRDATSTWPATVAMDNDSLSQSNNTSILLLKPAGSWTGKVTETQWLCFYDQTTWPAAQRAAGALPTGCTVKTP